MKSALYGFDDVPTDSEYPVLLLGSSELGKRSWCQSQAAGVPLAKVYEKLDYRAADEITTLSATKSVPVLVIDLTDSTIRAQSKLLHVLENPGAFGKIFLHADTKPSFQLITPLISRCLTVTIPLLPDHVIYDVCRSHGMDDAMATLCTAMGWGCPGRAVTALHYIRAKRKTQKALSAIAEGDMESLDSLCASATADDVELLRRALYEIRSGKYAVWIPEEVEPLRRVQHIMQTVLDGSTKLPVIAYTAILYAARHAL